MIHRIAEECCFVAPVLYRLFDFLFLDILHNEACVPTEGFLENLDSVVSIR